MKFYNKDNSLSFYSFSCGYIESYDEDQYWVKLEKDNCCWHVKIFDNYLHSSYSWESFAIDELTLARKHFYTKIKDCFGLSKLEYLKAVTIKENRNN